MRNRTSESGLVYKPIAEPCAVQMSRWRTAVHPLSWSYTGTRPLSISRWIPFQRNFDIKCFYMPDWADKKIYSSGRLLYSIDINSEWLICGVNVFLLFIRVSQHQVRTIFFPSLGLIIHTYVSVWRCNADSSALSFVQFICILTFRHIVLRMLTTKSLETALGGQY